MLVFEDLHWADDNLLDFVDYLVDWATDSPLLVLGTARPELLERRPGWGGGKSNAADHRRSHRSPRRRRRASWPACSSETVMPAELQAPLLARAGGNPLYAEEYARMVSEARSRASGRAPLPETVQGIVAARLDALSAEEKALIQDAAVIGKVFWSGRARRHERARSAGRSRSSCTRSSERSSCGASGARRWRPRPSTSSATSSSATSPMDRCRAQTRAEKHRRAAEWIETLGADREDRAEMLAHHYASALEFARAAGQPVDALAERARVALFEAGERAYGLYAYGARRGSTEMRVELWPAGDPGRGSSSSATARSVSLSRLGSRRCAQILEEARDLLLAVGAREVAAEAEVALVDTTGFVPICRSDAAGRAGSAVLIEGVEPSVAREGVRAQRARAVRHAQRRRRQGGRPGARDARDGGRVRRPTSCARRR